MTTDYSTTDHAEHHRAPLITTDHPYRYHWSPPSPQASHNTPHFDALAEAVFKAFDLDNSGEVGEREFRDLLTIIYPGMPRSLVQSTIALVRPYYDHNGNLQVLLPPTALVHPCYGHNGFLQVMLPRVATC